MVPDAVFVVDADARVVRYVNSAAVALLGYTRDELIGMAVEQIRPELPDEQRRTRIEELFAGSGRVRSWFTTWCCAARAVNRSPARRT